MLTALNHNNDNFYAWEAEKSDGPFYCPECGSDLILRKGLKKAHHFSHKPPVNCIYGSGESEIHYQIKRELYEYLSKQSNCSLCEIERSLGEVRPDVSLRINNKRVAIEIQKSNIDIRTIYKRMHKYNELNIFVLWIISSKKPEWIIHNNGDFVHRIKEWEVYLHALNYGRLYYWQGDSKIKAYHFFDYNIYRDVSGFYSEGGEFQTFGGYTYKVRIPVKPATHSGFSLPPKGIFHFLKSTLIKWQGLSRIF